MMLIFKVVISGQERNDVALEDGYPVRVGEARALEDDGILEHGDAFELGWFQVGRAGCISNVLVPDVSLCSVEVDSEYIDHAFLVFQPSSESERGHREEGKKVKRYRYPLSTGSY